MLGMVPGSWKVELDIPQRCARGRVAAMPSVHLIHVKVNACFGTVPFRPCLQPGVDKLVCEQVGFPHQAVLMGCTYLHRNGWTVCRRVSPVALRLRSAEQQRMGPDLVAVQRVKAGCEQCGQRKHVLICA